MFVAEVLSESRCEHGAVETGDDLNVARDHDEPGIRSLADQDVPRLQRGRTLEQMRGDSAFAADDIAIAAFDDMRADHELELARTRFLYNRGRHGGCGCCSGRRLWCGCGFRFCGSGWW